MGDWDYINEHMGGWDDSGLPNFIKSFAENEDKNPEVDTSLYRPVEKWKVWPSDRTDRSVEEQVVLESLRALTLSLNNHLESTGFDIQEARDFYKSDKFDFDAGFSRFDATGLAKRKALIEEQELAYSSLSDELMAIENVYLRARWLADQSSEVKTALMAETLIPMEDQNEVAEVRASRSEFTNIHPTYPLFIATTTFSIDLNQEVLVEAVRYDKRALEFASESFKDDRSIVLEAVKSDGLALNYASDVLKDDRGVVLEAVKEDGRALEFASDALRNDREIVLEAVKNNGGVFQYASDTLKEDQEIKEIYTKPF